MASSFWAADGSGGVCGSRFGRTVSADVADAGGVNALAEPTSRTMVLRVVMRAIVVFILSNVVLLVGGLDFKFDEPHA